MPISIRQKDYIRTTTRRYPGYGQTPIFCEFIVFDLDETMSQCFVWQETKKGFDIEEDYSDYHEINFVVDGAVYVIDSETGKSFVAQPGDIYILDRKVRFGTRTGDSGIIMGPSIREAFKDEMIPIPEEWD
jgi:hypothetical protein